jgi:chemotaxis protein histidine kinase CheA
MASNPGEDQFFEEVIGLFALEAQEWISQIQGALGELEGGAAPEGAAKLYEVILRGLTNLGGSAATVELTAIEEVALALMPLIQAMQANGATVEQFAAVHAGLEAITSVILQVGETGGATAVDLSPVVRHISNAASTASAPAGDTPDKTVPVQERTVLDALLDLRDQAAPSGEPIRNTVDLVLQKVRDASGEPAAIDAPRILSILQELSRQDEQFLADLAQRLPRIVEAFPVFKQRESGSGEADERIEPIFQDIRSLQDAAHAVRATAVMLFFAGLETFFRIATSRKVPIMPERFDAVESRLGNIEPRAHEWVELGRQQRASIEHLL